MNISAISDTHGWLPDNEFLGQGDVLCICGDIFPLYIQTDTAACKEWLEENFIPWTDYIQYTYVVLIAGNHDFFFANTSFKDILLLFDSTKVTYLQDSYTIINGVKFYGTPWCKQFCDWAFMLNTKKLTSKFNQLPDDVDILLTHDAPFGISDICAQDISWNDHEHIGNKPLTLAILEKSPKIVLHGHLHTSNHNLEMLGSSKVYNVSLLDENYHPEYEPLVFTI